MLLTMSDFRVTDLLLNASKEAPLNGVTYYSPARQVCNTTIYVSLLQASQELGHKIKKHLGRKRCAVLLYADSQVSRMQNQDHYTQALVFGVLCVDS
jgi:hypothetical protein